MDRTPVKLLLGALLSSSASDLHALQDVEPIPNRAALFDELLPLHPDSVAATGAASLELHAARGSTAGVHLLVRGHGAESEVSLAFPDLDPAAGEGPAPVLYRLLDVPVEQNTGLVSRTERWDGSTNPHVIRRAPFRVYEVLQPCPRRFEPGCDPLALRIEFEVPADAAPGSHSYRIALRAGAWTRELSINLVIHRATVPAPGQSRILYTNWFSPGLIANRHGLKLWSEPFWAMLESYARLMARGRQNTFWVRWQDVFERDAAAAPRLNAERLKRYVRVFQEAGFSTIEGAPLARRPRGDWSSPLLELAVTGTPATSEQGQAELLRMGAELQAVIRERGWEGLWIQHLADEPTDTNAEDYRRLAGIFRSALPGVPILEATMSRRLVGAVDIWCPQVQEYQKHREFFAERKAAGDRVMVYTCLIPGGPWINRLLDQERLRPVCVGWALARYDLDGFLHWGLNHYRPGIDPFQQSVVRHGGPEDVRNYLPAGDSHVVYPGSNGPWSGQRFEAHRIGLEDYELLQQLRARQPDRAAALLEAVFRAFDDFETEVAAYRKVRLELLGALDGVD